MAFNIGNLVGFVKIDHSGVKSGMAAADREVKSGMARAGQSADKGGKDVGRKFGDGVAGSVRGSLKTLSTAIVGAFAVDRVVQFIGASVDAASQLEQSVGGVDAVFGRYADNVHEKSKQAAQDLGLSKNAYNELITVSAAMLKNKGLTDFAQRSEDLVKVGADLAAQFGGPTSQAVEALNAAMRGESDPIERYGISLNEAAVNAKMAEMGLKGLEGAALEQAKTQARLALITEQSADAQGAFARESETAAGKAQRTAAEWENQRAALGEKLLPAMIAVTDFASSTLIPTFGGVVDLFAGLAKVVGGLPGPVKAALLALVAFHLLKGPLGGMLDSTRTKVGQLSASMKGLGAAGVAKASLGGLMNMLGGPWGIAMAGASIAFLALMEDLQRGEKQVTAIRDALTELYKAGEVTPQKRLEQFLAVFKDDLPEIRAHLEKAGISWSDYTRAIANGGPELDEMERRLRAAGDGAGIFGDHLGATIDITSRWNSEGKAAAEVGADIKDSLDNVGDGAKGATPKLKGYEDIVGGIEQNARDAEEANRDLAQAMLDVTGAAIDADEAEANYKQTLMDAAEAAENLKGGVNKARTEFNLMTEAGQEKSQTMRDLARDAEKYAKALLTDGESVDTVKTKMGDLRTQFVNAAVDMGLSREAAERMADEYGVTEGKVDDLKTAMDKIPAEVVSDLKVETSAATVALKNFKLLYDSIGNKKVTLSAVYQTLGFNAAQTYRNTFAGYERDGGPLRGYAGGGLITGPGTPTSDSITALVRETGNLIAVSNREFVANGASTARNLAALEAGNRGATLTVANSGDQGPVELGPKTIRRLADALAGVRVTAELR